MPKKKKTKKKVKIKKTKSKIIKIKKNIVSKNENDFIIKTTKSWIKKSYANKKTYERIQCKYKTQLVDSWR